jgi:hypothetical protein
MPDVTDEAQAAAIGERIRRSLPAPATIAQEPAPIHVSAELASTRVPGTPPTRCCVTPTWP